MGICLRGKMTDAGILPGPAAVASADAETDAPATTVANIEPEVGVGDATLDVTPAPEAADDLIAATFGLLRAEPDGSVVIAGSGTPGSEVEIYSGDDLLGTATVESSGDWVFVPDEPIAPGGTEITLAEAGKPGRAEQSFVVVIDEDRSSEPLVVASTPGTISEVLQGLNRPTQVAAVDPVTAPEAAATAPATTAPQAAAVAVEAAPATPEAVPAPEAAEPEQVAATAAPTTQPPLAADPATASPTAIQQPEAASPAIETTSATPPASVPAPATAAVQEPPAAVEAPSVESADPAPVATEPMAPAAAGPTIDAIEIEGDRTFFAGAGPDGATLRLYVDDTYIADAVVADGRWLVEAGRVLTRPEQRVRADLLQPGSADVAARAEVDFVVDLPASDAQIAMADAPPAPSPSASVPAAPAQTTPAAPIAGVAEAPVGATTPAEPQPSPTTEVSQAAAQPGPATAATTPSQPEPSTAPAQPETGGATTEGATSAPPTSATSEDLSVPTLVAVQVGGPDAERFASGKAIIRRGDNLWTIARRVYGEGIKYTTIYDANTGQIRDPDRIYPGQVFDLPN